MNNKVWLAGAMLGLSAIVLPAVGENAPAEETGYTVMVQFDVDSAGAVTNATVVSSENKELNSFALGMVNAGQLLPDPLPAAGSNPRHIKAPVFFPVEPYNSGKLLPAGVVMPRPKFQPCPMYPYECRKKDITGGARLSITIGKSGKVTDCKIIKSSNQAFGEAAQDAAYKWVFLPATLNGKPVEVTINVPISFEIEGKPHGWKWLVAPAPSMSSFVVESLRL